MNSPVLAATAWPTNAAMIADMARLRYLRPGWKTLDPTYGVDNNGKPAGGWWKQWRPNRLVLHDLALDGVDYRDLPHRPGEFDAAVYDPPYVSPGGRETSTIKSMHAAFGMASTPTTPRANQDYNNLGLAEVARVTRPAGYILTKCQDYITGGKLQPGTHWTIEAALALGLEYVDRFEHYTPTEQRPQPANRTRRYCTVCDETTARAATRCQECGSPDLDTGPVRQRHGRRNLSTLLVLRKPKGNTR